MKPQFLEPKYTQYSHTLKRKNPSITNSSITHSLNNSIIELFKLKFWDDFK